MRRLALPLAAFVGLCIAGCGGSSPHIKDAGCHAAGVQHLRYDCQDPVRTMVNGKSCSARASSHPSTEQPIYGSDGNEVATLEVVTSQTCQYAAWPRVKGIDKGNTQKVVVVIARTHPANQAYYEGTAEGTGVVYGGMINSRDYCVTAEATVGSSKIARTRYCLGS